MNPELEKNDGVIEEIVDDSVSDVGGSGSDVGDDSDVGDSDSGSDVGSDVDSVEGGSISGDDVGDNKCGTNKCGTNKCDTNKYNQSGGANGDEAEDENEEDENEEDENYLQKFSKNMRDNLITNFHPEAKVHNYEEIKQLAKVTRNKNGIIVDELHKTIPILTKYEKTRILGQRAKQIETGAVTLVNVPPNVIDSYLIAKLEMKQNKIPFIIRRPLPNGGMEYWYVSDLEDL
jgi:DNA-directed RNA polymerase subunit K/omega